MRFLFILFALAPFTLVAQSIAFDGAEPAMEIGKYVSLLKDSSGKLSISQVSSPTITTKFTLSEKQNLSLGYSTSIFWLKFSVNNQTAKPIILELAQAGLPQVDLYYKNNDAPFTHLTSGYQVPVFKKPIQSSFQAFELPVGHSVCYVRLNSNSEPIPVRLFTPRAYDKHATYQKFTYGVYVGLMFFVALLNVFFFISLKKRIHLFYALIVLIYIGYSAAVIDGFIVYFIPKVDLLFLYTTIPALGITLQTLYSLYFLEAKKYTPKVYQIVLGFAIYSGLWAIIKFFFSFPIVQPINTVNALISFFMMGFVGVKTGNKGNRLGYYFALAYFIYFSLVVAQAIYINTGSPAYLGGLSHVAFATLIEAFLLSFLLSQRSEWEREAIEKEKMAAQQQVIETIQEKEKLIEQQNTFLEKEVDKRTSQLKFQNKELNELNKTKDRFFSIISHDLRSPVNAFSGLASLLKSSIGSKDYEHLPETANRLSDAASQLSVLLDNLLDWALSQKGEFPFSPEQIQLNELLQEVVKNFENMATSKNITLEISAKEQIEFVADRNSVMTILRNLISNALKFTENGGKVTITSKTTTKHVLIKVKDTGVGIPKEKLATLFSFSESTKGSSGEKGLGLGLRLAYEFSLLNKGKLEAKSTPGKGAEFIVTLPVMVSYKS